MWWKQHKITVLLLCFLCLIAAVALIFQGKRALVSSSNQTAQHNKEQSSDSYSCVREAALIDDVGKAKQLAESYFGGAQGYDLTCVRAAYSRALELNPRGSVSSWHQLGRVDFLEGKFNAAIYKFNKQIEYFGDLLPNVHYMLGLTYGYMARVSGRESDWEHAEDEFKKYLEHGQDEWPPRVDLAWIYFSQGKYEEMKPLLEEALEMYPNNPWLLNMYGLALQNTGDQKDAYQYFTRALSEADKLSTEDWGKAYPGNDPGSYPKGLAEMRAAIAHNVEISSN